MRKDIAQHAMEVFLSALIRASSQRLDRQVIFLEPSSYN